MTKENNNYNKFDEIVITDDILTDVVEFKPIIARGKSRYTLNSESHKALVRKKYNDAKGMDDHITLFRVADKSYLPDSEKEQHTVQGPEWTPPSSAGFVMGAQNVRHRIWLATHPTEDNSGLLGKNGEPSIYARENMTALSAGWMARETQKNEKYGIRSKKAPVEVLTPPSSPVFVPSEDLRKIMDVTSNWDSLPMNLSDMTILLTPIPKELTDALKKSRLTRNDLDNKLLSILVNTKGVLDLVSQNNLSIKELNDVSIEVVEVLFEQEEVITMLANGILFGQLKYMYDEYISYNNHSREFSFSKLNDLVTNHEEQLIELLNTFGLTVKDIINLYNNDYNMFCDFVNNDAISFFQNHHAEIDLQELIDIYKTNIELFYDLITDEEDVLGDINVKEFIDRYKEIQNEHSEYHSDEELFYDDDILSGRVSICQKMRNEITYDNCPDEMLFNDSDLDYEENNYYDSDPCDLESDEEEYENYFAGNVHNYYEDLC